MKLKIQVTALLLTLLAGVNALAAVSVDSLNYPVWVERNGQSLPLAPGDRLRAGDVVQTGQYGRAWLGAEDGSVVKLGQDTRLVVNRAEIRSTDNGSVFDAALDVLKGAFRFTSGFFTPERPASHRVNFKIGAITAGVRGTDIWGRSADKEDFVALIDGVIEVSSEGDTAKLMDQPLTLYRKQTGEPADAVQSVALETVQRLGTETELDAEAGIANVAGEYQLMLMSLRTPELIEAWLKRFWRTQ